MNGTPRRFSNAGFFSDNRPAKVELQALHQTFPLHWHEFHEVGLVLDGFGSNIVNGVRYPLRPGSMFLLSPADFHAIGPDAGEVLHLYNANLSQKLLVADNLMSLFGDRQGSHAWVKEPEQVRLLAARFANLDAELCADQEGRDLALQSELNLILLAFQRHRLPPIATPARSNALAQRFHGCHPGIQNALVYLHQHFRQAVTLEDMARAANLSRNYFSELFKKSVGLPFQNYLQQIRLDFARALLASSQLPVTEVSYAAGFNTLTHFERVYRAQFGEPPSRMRREPRTPMAA